MVTKKQTLDTARSFARAHFALNRDYHALSIEQKEHLNRLMRRTVWRQGPSAAAQGRSRAYSFWLALGGA